MNYKILFAMSSDENHYMDAKVVEIPIERKHEYLQSWRKNMGISLHMLKSELPTAKVDTISYQENIAGIIFYAQKTQMNIDENQYIAQYNFLAIFENKAFGVNIVAADPKKEKLMLNAFRKSTFGVKEK